MSVADTTIHQMIYIYILYLYVCWSITSLCPVHFSCYNYSIPMSSVCRMQTLWCCWSVVWHRFWRRQGPGPARIATCEPWQAVASLCWSRWILQILLEIRSVIDLLSSRGLYTHTHTPRHKFINQWMNQWMKTGTSMVEIGEIPDDLGAGSSGRQYAGAAGVWWSWGSGSRQNVLAQRWWAEVERPGPDLPANLL